MFKSIRKNLIFNFVVMSAIILITNTTFSTYQMIAGLQNQMKYDGGNLANIIKISIENAGIDNISKVQAIVDETYDHSEGNLFYIGVTLPDKTLIAGTSKDSIGQKIDSKELESVFKGKTEAFMSEWKNTPAYNVTVPIKQGEKVVLSVSVGISVNNMEDTIKSSIMKSIISGIIILIMVTIAAIIIAKRIAEPIESMEVTVGEIGKGDLTTEYKVKGKDEIGRLAYTSNETTKSLRVLIKKIKSISLSLVNEVLQKTMKGKDKIISTVENIASNSEEISSLSQEVTASTEEQSAITNEIAIAAKKLLNMAKALENNTSSFKV